MTLAFSRLPTIHSFLARLDPRWKLAALALAALASTLPRSLPATTATFLAALLLAMLGRLPLRWYLSRLAWTFVFLAPFALTLPWLLPTPDDPDRPWWRPGWPGIALGLLVTLKAFTVLTLVLVLLAGTPWHVTLKAAHALRVPGFLVQLFALTYRYLWVLVGEFSRLRIALRVRGFRNRMTRHSYRTIGHVAGTLLVRGHERGERVGQAMRCRGFDGHFRALAEFHTTLGDVAFFLAAVGVSAGLVVWDFAVRSA